MKSKGCSLSLAIVVLVALLLLGRFLLAGNRSTEPAQIPNQTMLSARESTARIVTLMPLEARIVRGTPMMLVPAGEFLMGSSDADADAQGDEKPQHSVFLDAFWMDKFEVTNGQYKRCVDVGQCAPLLDHSSYTRHFYYGNPEFDDYPVIYVSWIEARAFCEWAGKRLPTEAEWEKAARGTDGRIYPWGNIFEASRLNSLQGGPGDTTKVGSWPAGASPYGIMDMAGNVEEWVADWYARTFPKNPVGPSSGQFRILRGGAWSHPPALVRAAYRDGGYPSNFGGGIGFRCAMSFSP